MACDYTVTGQDALTIVMESGVGGRIYERTPDGAEYDWGEVTTWSPPKRLAYLWHLRPGPFRRDGGGDPVPRPGDQRDQD